MATPIIEAVSTHEQIIQAAVQRIQGLNLKRIGDNVKGGMFIKGLSQTSSFPIVLVMKNGNEMVEGGTNLSDDIRYPVVVMILDRIAPEDQTDDDDWTLWRQVIRKAFIMQRLAGVPTVYKTEYAGGEVVNVDAMASVDWMKLIGTLAFGFVCRELRNTNP